MDAMASQITGGTIIYSTVCSGADQRTHQCSASLAFVRGIHRWPMNSPHKGPVTRKMFPFDDVTIIIMHHLSLAGHYIPHWHLVHAICSHVIFKCVVAIRLNGEHRHDNGCLYHSFNNNRQSGLYTAVVKIGTNNYIDKKCEKYVYAKSTRELCKKYSTVWDVK